QVRNGASCHFPGDSSRAQELVCSRGERIRHGGGTAVRLGGCHIWRDIVFRCNLKDYSAPIQKGWHGVEAPRQILGRVPVRYSDHADSGRAHGKCQHGRAEGGGGQVFRRGRTRTEPWCSTRHVSAAAAGQQRSARRSGRAGKRRRGRETGGATGSDGQLGGAMEPWSHWAWH
ncbi:hypothetical protein BS50DRAFT_668942, partial [Corynespora cassiicola Philippines]